MGDNVMRGESLLSQYQTELGPVTFTFRDSLLPRISFTIRPLYGIVKNFADGNEFDLEQSLYNITPVFKRSLGRNHNGGTVTGSTMANVMNYTPNAGKLLGYPEQDAKDIDKSVLSHEMNHVLAWSKFRFGSDLVNWFPSEIFPFVPEMEEVQMYWNVGQDLSYTLMRVPLTLSGDGGYYYDPLELDAYSMQRP